VFQTRLRSEITNGMIGDTGIDIMGNKIINQQNYVIVMQCKNYVSNSSKITPYVLEKLCKRTSDFPTAISVLMCYDQKRLNDDAKRYMENNQSKLIVIDLQTILPGVIDPISALRLTKYVEINFGNCIFFAVLP
jgi:hypothetical protein